MRSSDAKQRRVSGSKQCDEPKWLKESGVAREQRIGAGIGVAGGAIAYHSAGPQFQFDVATAGTSLLKLADAETAHRIGMWAASKGLVPRETRLDPPSLHTRVWGRDFPNPLGKRGC